MDRRTFLECCGAMSLLPFTNQLLDSRRILGVTGVRVSPISVGTGDLHRIERREAVHLLRMAYRGGVNLFDAASAYGNGLSETCLGNALSPYRDDCFILSKTLSRSQNNSASDLQQSLRHLRTAHLDAWLIHDLRTQGEWEELCSTHGALPVFLEAKRQGNARWIGLSANRNPQLVLDVIRQIPLDILMIPVTPVDSPFVKTVLPAALDAGIGVLGIRTLGLPKKALRSQDDVRKSIEHALSLPISSVVLGFENREQININLSVGKNLFPSLIA